VTRSGRPAAAALRLAAAGLATAGAVAGVTACGGSTPAETRQQTAKMERVGHSNVLSVVLTPLGAARIGVQTAPVTITPANWVVPYSALLYEPDGAAAVYVNTAPLVYTRYFVSVGAINGNQVDLKPGSLPAGVRVVTTGAEELLGVQNGVGEET
jgi:hypothetical protein